MGGGIVRILNIGLDMLYFVGNIGMATAAQTRKNDFVWDWMLLPMPNYIRGEEMRWVDISEAFNWFDSQEPFRLLLNLYTSEYINVESFPITIGTP